MTENKTETQSQELPSMMVSRTKQVNELILESLLFEVRAKTLADCKDGIKFLLANAKDVK